MNFKLNKIIKYVILFQCLLFQTHVAAIDLDSPSLQVNGFGSLSLTRGDSDEIGFRDDNSQVGVFDEWSAKQNSSLGLQLNYQALDDLELTFQVLAKDRYKNSLNKSIQSAYLKYDISPGWELRLGRFLSDIYLLSEYRNVGYAYLWAKPPAEFYGSLTFGYADGVALKRYGQLADGQWSAYLFYVEADYLNVQNSKEELDDELDPTIGITTEWENNNWRIKLNIARSKYQSSNNNGAILESALKQLQPIWPESSSIIDEVDINDTYVRYYSAGVSYNKFDWIAQSELSYIKTESDFATSFRSAYVSVGHKFGDITPYVTAAFTQNKKAVVPSYQINPFLPASVNAQALAVQTALLNEVAKSRVDQKTLSFGVRYDILPKAAIKAQWDRTWVEPGAAAMFDIRTFTQTKQTRDRFTITMDFVF